MEKVEVTYDLAMAVCWSVAGRYDQIWIGGASL